ncbi:hypothetical protein LTS17_010704 [Exophiala oligosperma]
MPKTSSSGEKARLRAGPASDPPPTSLTPTTNNHVGADHDGSNSQHLLHPQQQQQHPNDLPPSYDVINPPLPSIPTTTTTISSSSLPILSQNPLDAISRLTSIDLPKYCGVSQAKLSASHDALTTTKPELSTTQYALMRFLNEQAPLPPKPLMLIQGSHTTSNGTTQVDFDITLNLTSLLDLDVPSTNGTAPSSSSSTTTTTAATTRLQVDPFESSSPTTSSSSTSHFKRSSRGNNQSMTPLEQWVKKFIDEKTENKSFSLRRQIVNFPTTILEGMVRTLLAATKYRGKVTVEFPVQFSEVVVQRQSGNWFTNILRLYPTKKYDVAQTVWDVSSSGISRDDVTATMASSSSSSSSTQQQQQQRQGRAALVAQEWWREWQYAIWNAVLKRRTGWVTVEDWIEAKMGVKMPQPNREWGVEATGW